MIRHWLALSAAAATAVSPCLAAELPDDRSDGVRRSGAVAGAYFRVPLDGRGAMRPQAGLRLSMTHDYRTAGAGDARVVETDSFDLRLAGDREATLYVAGRPVTGEEADRRGFGPINTAVTVAILVAAAVGAYFIVRAIDDSGEE